MTTRHRYIELVLAAILLCAAILKADFFLHNLGHNGIRPTPDEFGLGLEIVIESSIAIWMVAGWHSAIRFRYVASFFCLLAVAASVEAVRAAPSCGCFGRFQIPPKVTAIFDVTAVISLWITRQRVRPHQGRRPLLSRVWGVIAVVCVASMYPTIMFISSSASASDRVTGSLTSDPFSWVGREFPLFDEMDQSQEMKTGRWRLIFYHFDCEECRQIIPTYLEIAKMGQTTDDRDQLAFVEVPPIAPVGKGLIPTSSDWRHFNLRQDRNWMITTPMILVLKNGRVISVTEGDHSLTPFDSN
jgi:hypothetical protein